MTTSAAPLPDDLEHRYLEVLVKVGEILATAPEWHQTVDAVCEAIVDTVADLCFLHLKDSNGNLELAAAASGRPELKEQLRAPFARQVFGGGEPVCIPEVDEAFLESIAVSAAHGRFMRHMNYRSIISVPLQTKTQGILGVLVLVRTDRTAEPYNARSLRFVEDLARRCAAAISKAMLYEQTLRIATLFQRAALPARLPKIEGISLDAFYEPSSQDMLVGGDWYDAFALPDGRIAITLGDVLGHGLEAAVWMSRLRNGFRAALFGDPDPARSLQIVDHMLRSEGDEEFFTTALVALIDPSRQTLCCASAGHPGPLVWMGTGEAIDPFGERGLPLGLRDIAPALQTSQTLNVHAAAFAAFFTDGLLEWNRDIASSWSALHQAIEQQAVREGAHPAKMLRDAVITGPGHQDDVAVLTVRWEVEKRPALQAC